jgi:hypothetical protein
MVAREGNTDKSSSEGGGGGHEQKNYEKKWDSVSAALLSDGATRISTVVHLVNEAF